MIVAFAVGYGTAQTFWRGNTRPTSSQDIAGFQPGSNPASRGPSNPRSKNQSPSVRSLRALAHDDSQSLSFNRFQTYISAVTKASANDLPKLYHATKELPIIDRTLLMPFLLEQWLEVDPEKLISEAFSDLVENHDFESIIVSWAKRDPERVLELMSEHFTVSEQLDVVHTVIGTIANDDPHRAISLAKSIENAALRMEALTIAADEISEKEPEMALALLREEPALMENETTILAFQSLLNKDKLDTAIDWVNGLKTQGERLAAMEDLVKEWTGFTMDEDFSSSPEDVLQWIEINADPGMKDALNLAVLSKWSRHPKDALNYLPLLSSASDRQKLLKPLLPKLMNVDPELALQTLQNETSGSAQLAATNSILDNTQFRSKESAERMLAHLDEWPSVNKHERLLRDYASSASPQEALAWLETRSEQQFTQSINSIVEVWARKDPASAISYISELEGEAQTRAGIAVFSSGALRQADSHQTARKKLQWIDSLDASVDTKNALLEERIQSHRTELQKYLNQGNAE